MTSSRILDAIAFLWSAAVDAAWALLALAFDLSRQLEGLLGGALVLLVTGFIYLRAVALQ
ncbi:MAG: hypothetical protein GY953_41305, partial [bacterium]|nr:hypothetical protein [bacterium]